MEIKEGYVYHIKDEYFSRVRDEHLMRNKEHGGYRPALLCFQDEVFGILWFVPLTSKVEKFQAIYDQKVARYGDCLGVEMGEYGGRGSAFLIQNLFPALPEDIHHIHEIGGTTKPVRFSTLKKVRKKAKKVVEITKRGKKITFTNIKRLEEQLLRELEVRAWIKNGQFSENRDEDILSLEETLSLARESRQEKEAKIQKTRAGPLLRP